MHRIEKSFANISLKHLAGIVGLTTTNMRKAVTKRSTYVRTGLSKSDIKVYLTIWFLANSGTGCAKFVNIKDLAAITNVTLKTVILCIKRLEKMDKIKTYTITCEDDLGFLDIQIIGYEELALKRGEGGQGYLTMEKNMLKDIVDCNDVNEIRILLRMLIQTATDELFSASSEAVSVLTFKQILNGLPEYVKPGTVRATIERNKKYFSAIQYIDKRIKITLCPDMQARNIKNKIRTEAKLEISQFTYNLNRVVSDTRLSIYREMKKSIIHNGFYKLPEHIIEKFNALNIILPEHFKTICQQEYFASCSQAKTTNENEFFMSEDYEVNETDQCNDSILMNIPEIALQEKDVEDAILLAQDYGITAVLDAIKRYYSIYVLGNIEHPNNCKRVGGLLRTILRECKAYQLA